MTALIFWTGGGCLISSTSLRRIWRFFFSLKKVSKEKGGLLPGWSFISSFAVPAPSSSKMKHTKHAPDHWLKSAYACPEAKRPCSPWVLLKVKMKEPSPAGRSSLSWVGRHCSHDLATKVNCTNSHVLTLIYWSGDQGISTHTACDILTLIYRSGDQGINTYTNSDLLTLFRRSGDMA